MNTADIYSKSTGQKKELSVEEIEFQNARVKEQEAREQRIEVWLKNPTTQEFLGIIDRIIGSRVMNAGIMAVHSVKDANFSHERMIEIGTLLKVKNMIPDFNYDKVSITSKEGN